MTDRVSLLAKHCPYGALLQVAPYLKDNARGDVGALFETNLSDIVAANRTERTAAQIAMPPNSLLKN